MVKLREMGRRLQMTERQVATELSPDVVDIPRLETPSPFKAFAGVPDQVSEDLLEEQANYTFEDRTTGEFKIFLRA